MVYYRSTAHIPRCKIVVLGGGGVGKSALTLQFVEDEFVEDYDPTFEECYRTMLGEQAILDIFDTAGQEEEYSSMIKEYIIPYQGFLMVYSITSRSSFINELNGLRSQILCVKDSDSVPMVLVGNKCDLDEERQVETIEGENLAKEWNCPFFESSARHKINVYEMFSKLVKEIKRAHPECVPNIAAPKEKKYCLLM